MQMGEPRASSRLPSTLVAQRMMISPDVIVFAFLASPTKLKLQLKTFGDFASSGGWVVGEI